MKYNIGTRVRAPANNTVSDASYNKKIKDDLHLSTYNVRSLKEDWKKWELVTKAEIIISLKWLSRDIELTLPSQLHLRGLGGGGPGSKIVFLDTVTCGCRATRRFFRNRKISFLSEDIAI